MEVLEQARSGLQNPVSPSATETMLCASAMNEKAADVLTAVKVELLELQAREAAAQQQAHYAEMRAAEKEAELRRLRIDSIHQRPQFPDLRSIQDHSIGGVEERLSAWEAAVRRSLLCSVSPNRQVTYNHGVLSVSGSRSPSPVR